MIYVRKLLFSAEATLIVVQGATVLIAISHQLCAVRVQAPNIGRDSCRLATRSQRLFMSVTAFYIVAGFFLTMPGILALRYHLNVTEGMDVDLPCDFTLGNRSSETVKVLWEHKQHGKVLGYLGCPRSARKNAAWSGDILNGKATITLSNVQKNASGEYTCQITLPTPVLAVVKCIMILDVNPRDIQTTASTPRSTVVPCQGTQCLSFGHGIGIGIFIGIVVGIFMPHGIKRIRRWYKNRCKSSPAVESTPPGSQDVNAYYHQLAATDQNNINMKSAYEMDENCDEIQSSATCQSKDLNETNLMNVCNSLSSSYHCERSNRVSNSPRN